MTVVFTFRLWGLRRLFLSEIQDIVNSRDYSEQCTKELGWFLREQINEIRVLIKRQVQQWVENAEEKNDDVNEEKAKDDEDDGKERIDEMKETNSTKRTTDDDGDTNMSMPDDTEEDSTKKRSKKRKTTKKPRKTKSTKSVKEKTTRKKRTRSGKTRKKKKKKEESEEDDDESLMTSVTTENEGDSGSKNSLGLFPTEMGLSGVERELFGRELNELNGNERMDVDDEEVVEKRSVLDQSERKEPKKTAVDVRPTRRVTRLRIDESESSEDPSEDDELF